MRSHKSCPDERENRLATPEEARRATISADRLKDVGDFWPGFQAALRLEHGGKPARPAARPSWRWALGTAGLLAFVGIGILVPLLSRRGPSPRASVEGPFRLDSVMIEEKPAQAFIFHTQDPDITYVWVEKQL